MREVLIKITQNCPCSCLFCKPVDIENENIQTKELGIEQWLQISEKLIAHGVKIVIISGGEPFTRFNDVLTLINFYKRNNVYVVLNTSGVFFKQKSFLNRLLLNYPDILIFSIDSSEHLQHDKNRNIDGLFLKNLETINNIKKADQKYAIGIRVVITRYNYFQLPRIIYDFNTLGVDCIRLTNIENDRMNQFRLSLKDLNIFNSEIRPKIIETFEKCSFSNVKFKRDAIIKINNLYNPQFINYKEFSNGIFSPSLIEFANCSLIDRFCFVKYNGEVIPCCESEYTDNPVCGNLLNNSLKQIFNESIYQQFKKKRVDYCKYCTEPHNFQISFTNRALIINKR